MNAPVKRKNASVTAIAMPAAPIMKGQSGRLIAKKKRRKQFGKEWSGAYLRSFPILHSAADLSEQGCRTDENGFLNQDLRADFTEQKGAEENSR